MAFFLRLALWASLVFWSASELVIDVQPNFISPEITPQLVINCSVTNNQVQHLKVIKSLTLSRYNETIKEFDDLFILNSSTLDLKQLKQLKFSQVSFGNLFITLAFHNPIELDVKVYRCNATGDNSDGTNISFFAKKTVEYGTNSTAFIEEIRRLKKFENHCERSLKKDHHANINQRYKFQFYGSSEIIQELIEPLTLKCSFKYLNYDQNEAYTLQSLFLLHESNSVIAYINKGQTVVTAIPEITSKNVKGELYDSKLKDSYLQVTWNYLKISDSGKYFCEAHVKYAEKKSEKLNEMLTIAVKSPALNDLVNVIHKLIRQVDEDKESIQVSKQNIENIMEDVNTHHQEIKKNRKEVELNKENITTIKEDLDIKTQNILSIRLDTYSNISMLKEDIDINAVNIKFLRKDIDGIITKLKEDLDKNKQLQINLQDNLKMKVVNISTDLTELKNQINEAEKLLRFYFVPPTSCLKVTSIKARVILMLTSGLKVMCDTKTDGGGWIIFQRRINGKVNFYRGWNEYRDGFGDYNIGEFYLGNENIFSLTSTGKYDLRIDLEYKNNKYFAQYKDFKILSETEKYKLQIGNYSGNAGDSFKRQNNMFFSTLDRENDIDNSRNCAQQFFGAWWYKDCQDSNLNGKWGSTLFAEGMNWYNLTNWYDSVTFSEMKIRERE